MKYDLETELFGSPVNATVDYLECGIDSVVINKGDINADVSDLLDNVDFYNAVHSDLMELLSNYEGGLDDEKSREGIFE